MTQENKQLLLKDLCARLPYGVKFASFSQSMKNHSEPVTLRQIYYHNECDANNIEGDNDISTIIEFVKPYLRPMSSMSEEEFLTLYDMCRDKVSQFSIHPTYYTDFKTKKYVPKFIYGSNHLDYLISRHFDYRGLIEKGLALEAPEGMYN